MDFMVPVGVRMDLADGSMRLRDEVGVPLNGRKRLYGKKMRSVILERSLRIQVGRSEETAARIKLSATEKLWVTRGERWVPTVTEGPGRIRYLVISNIGEEILRMDHRLDVGSEDEDEIYYHESSDLSAEDLEGNLAVLPEIPISTTAKVSIEDLQVGDSGSATPEEIEKLRQIIWKKRHLLIGNAKPIAMRTRKAPTRFREKVAGLIKCLLAAEIIRSSTSPWASPIVIVRKSNGVDIRLCIDYKLVNSLTRLMVYPMLLISDLLDDLDKALWYCSLDMASGSSLDMASGFWVVPMTDRACEISAFITHFGLFEWSRMPFGLKNAPQIYQRLVDNALYGFLKISQSGDAGTTTDVFQTGIADDPERESVLGRRSYIDDIMIAAESWDQMCQRDIWDTQCRSEVWRRIQKI
ncbi:reverse transcriptase, partial [Phytophthora megakarya]